MKYHLTCKNYSLNQIHETNSMYNLKKFWKNWNKKHGEKMKCVHGYVIEELE